VTAADGGYKKEEAEAAAAAAAAASDGSAQAPGRRPELPSFPGTAGVLKRKGSVGGPQPAPEARAGFLFACAQRLAA
jgi:hypothetical protein